MGCTGIHPDMRYTESLQLDPYPDLPIPCPSRVGSGHREPRSGAPVCLGSTCVCRGVGEKRECVLCRDGNKTSDNNNDNKIPPK